MNMHISLRGTLAPVGVAQGLVTVSSENQLCHLQNRGDSTHSADEEANTKLTEGTDMMC